MSLRINHACGLRAGPRWPVAAAAGATEPISSFGVTTSTTAAGGHPDLTRQLQPRGTGPAGGRRKRRRQPPAGSLREPQRDPDLQRSRDFALSHARPTRRSARSSVRANYAGEPERPARHRPGLRRRRPGRRTRPPASPSSSRPSTSRSRSRSRCEPDPTTGCG